MPTVHPLPPTPNLLLLLLPQHIPLKKVHYALLYLDLWNEFVFSGIAGPLPPLV